MKEGLFDDLEDLPHGEIEDKVKQLDRDLRSLDEEFNYYVKIVALRLKL